MSNAPSVPPAQGVTSYSLYGKVLATVRPGQSHSVAWRTIMQAAVA